MNRDEVEALRERLNSMVLESELWSEEILDISRELDVLLLDYMKNSN